MTDLPALSTAADPAALALADGATPACGWLILPYDSRSFPFAELLKRDVFGVKRLDLLHEYLRRRRRALGTDDALTVHDNLTLRRLMQDLPDDSPFLPAVSPLHVEDARAHGRTAAVIFEPPEDARPSAGHAPGQLLP
jgi:hypothetical protein